MPSMAFLAAPAGAIAPALGLQGGPSHAPAAAAAAAAAAPASAPRAQPGLWLAVLAAGGMALAAAVRRPKGKASRSRGCARVAVAAVEAEVVDKSNVGDDVYFMVLIERQDGSKFQFETRNLDSVEVIKATLENELNVSAERLRLSFAGMELPDSATVGELGAEEGSTFQMVLKAKDEEKRDDYMRFGAPDAECITISVWMETSKSLARVLTVDVPLGHPTRDVRLKCFEEFKAGAEKKFFKGQSSDEFGLYQLKYGNLRVDSAGNMRILERDERIRERDGVTFADNGFKGGEELKMVNNYWSHCYRNIEY